MVVATFPDGMPYVIVVGVEDEDMPGGAYVDVRPGGGLLAVSVDDGKSIIDLLLGTVAALSGVPAVAYARMIEEHRKRGGGAPHRRAAQGRP